MAILSSKRMVSHRRGVGWSQFAAGALLGCALALLLPWAARTLSHRASATEARGLAAKLGPVRLTLGRLEGQTAYAPYPTPIGRQDGLALRRLCREVMTETASHTPTRLRDRAFCELAHKRLDAAVTALEEAVRIEPGDASLLSDLSALYGERAYAEDRLEDYAATLEMAERAVAISPGLQEAVFNRALAFEHFFLYEEAQGGWQHYLEIDGQSAWADEAQAHVMMEKYLRRPLRSRREDRLTDLLTEQKSNNFLLSWTEAMALRDHDFADPHMRMAWEVSDVLRGLDSSHFLPKFLAELATRRRSTRRSLTDPDDSGSRLEFVVGRATAGHCDPEEKWGLTSMPRAGLLAREFQQVVCRYQRNDIEGAQAALDRLDKNPQLAAYPSLQARQQLMLGLLAQRRSAFTDALASYHRALDLFSTLGEKQNEVSVQNLIAECLEALGQSSEAWRYRLRSLAWASRMPPTPQFHIALEQAVLASLAQGRPEVALDFQERLAKICLKVHGRLGSISTTLRGAQIKAALGRLEEARRDLGTAISVLQSPSFPGKDLPTLAARIDVVKGEIAARENRAAAIAWDLSAQLGTESLGQFAALVDFDFRQGDTVAAERDLERALEQIEQQRSKVAPGDYRVSFFNQAQPFYERMEALQLHLGRPAKALEVLERFRARALLDQLHEIAIQERGEIPTSTIASPLSWQDLSRHVPQHTVIVVYAVVEDRLVTWLVRPSGIEHIYWGQQPWSRVSTSIERLTAAQIEDPGGVRHILGELYQDLISPWKGETAAGDRIVFVPTRSLYNVPFAALVDPRSNRFLVQDHAVGVATSASEFVAAVERDRQISAGSFASVLLVANPNLSELANQLPPLPGAVREVEHLGRIYNGLNTRVMVGAEATPEHVLAAIRSSDIVHLAAHAELDPKDPARSHFVLASTGGYPGSLSAREILQLRLDHTRLVMLAACETQAGAFSPSEGSLSLATSFLAAGVPAVVGTLRPVEDQSTARLSVRFHQELRRGADALSALRTAQLEEIARQQGRFDWTWASFQVLGGVAERTPGNTTTPTLVAK